MTNKRWMKVMEKALPKMEEQGIVRRVHVEGTVVWDLTERGKQLVTKTAIT